MIMKTSVTAIAKDGKAVVTAEVHFGSVAASGGTVAFTDKTNHRKLGTAELKTKSGSPCAPPAHVCRARLTVSGTKLAKGANHIAGVFTPDRLYYPNFYGKTWLYLGVRPNCRNVAISTLPVFTASPIAHAAAGHGNLCKGRIQTKGAAVVVYSRNRAVVAHSTVVAFGDQRMPCATGQTGQLLAFSVSGSRAPGALAFEIFGKAATSAHRRHPNGYVCYESSIPFRTSSGKRAPHTDNGQYYGSLPHCRDNDGDDVYPRNPNGDDRQIHPAPCIEWQQYSVRHGVAIWTTWIQPTTGDPRLHTY